MGKADATAPEVVASPAANLVLTISQTGSVCSVVEAPDTIRDLFSSQENELSIDQLWPDPLAQRIRTALKRVLRDRKSHCIETEDDGGDAATEFIFVAQGPDRALVIARDLSQQKQALRIARQQAYTDDATGLPNRDYLFNELQNITDVQCLKKGRAALICIHVGQFDDHGYALNSTQQDEVLKQLAARLKTSLRGLNDNGRDDFERYSVATRTNYRQFTVVLPSIESGEDAEAVVERIIAILRLPVTVATRSLSIRACGGIALYPQDGLDPAALYENAIGAMEDARNDPSATFKFHSGTVRLRALQRNDLEVELKTALEQNHYALNYLPIIDAKTGITSALEALLRWPDAILGTQPTRKIVQIAERTGLIVPIGQWVFRKSCEQLQVWRRAEHADVRVAVNVSAQELVSEDLVAQMERILIDTGTNPCDLDVELKEHMLIREVRTDFATCKKMKELGIRIVVDDFGVGSCSLAQLAQSPVDAIKIDNSIVANLDAGNRDAAACAAAISMANELGIEVTAEGVETQQQADILRSQGCHYLQGFLISTPMNSDEATEYLKAGAQHQQRLDSVS